MCDCGCYDDLIEEFNFKLNEIFKSEEMDYELLSCINSLDTKIFTDSYYMTKSLKENKIRKQIEEFIENNDEKKEIFLDFDMVLKYIKQHHSLIKYIENTTDEQIISLATLNPKVLYMIDNISEDILIKILENNSETSLILDCDGIKLDDLYQNTYLYNKKEEILKNNDIYKLYINGLKKYLENDVLEYSHLSLEARNDIELAEFVLAKDNRLLAYTGDNIRKNKDIMSKMIKLNKDNIFYLDESIKDILI